jgi:hypothetical protein
MVLHDCTVRLRGGAWHKHAGMNGIGLSFWMPGKTNGIAKRFQGHGSP